MGSINAGVCHINATTTKDSFISSTVSTNSMYDAMLGTGEQNKHGLSYDGVHILVEEIENKEYIHQYINISNM